MTTAEKYYQELGGCSCHVSAPCGFCMSLDETEADIIWNGSYIDLEHYWKERELHEPEEQWVTIYEYAN